MPDSDPACIAELQALLGEITTEQKRLFEEAAARMAQYEQMSRRIDALHQAIHTLTLAGEVGSPVAPEINVVPPGPPEPTHGEAVEMILANARGPLSRHEILWLMPYHVSLQTISVVLTNLKRINRVKQAGRGRWMHP